MPRFQMDDSLYDDPAVIRAGTAAFGLYARCGDYVARHLLDGFVPSDVAAQYGTPDWTRKLTDAGLWKTVPDGHYMPRYLADNPSREKVLAERKRKSERQQRWLDKQRSASSGQRRVSRPSNRPSANGSIDGQRDAALPPSLTGRKGGRANSAALPAENPPQPPASGGHDGSHPNCRACGTNRRGPPPEPPPTPTPPPFEQVHYVNGKASRPFDGSKIAARTRAALTRRDDP
jgi:hypothetical protein